MKRVIKLIAFALVLIVPSIAYAANLTKADLTAAAEKYNKICEGEDSYLMTDEATGQCTPAQNIVVNDTTIEVSTIGQEGKLDYNYLIGDDGKITFSIQVPVQKGMTKGQYKAVEDPAAINSIPFILVAVARGSRIGAAQSYFVKSFSNTEFADQVYANCANLEGEALTNCLGSVGAATTGVGAQYTDAEFPNHVIEVAEGQFAQPRILKDEKPEQINSAAITTAFTKVDDERGRLDHQLVVDSNADFSKIDTSGTNPPTSTELPAQPEEKNPGTGASVQIAILVGLLIIGLIFLKQYGRRTIHNI